MKSMLLLGSSVAGLQCYSANTIRTFISSFEEVMFVREGTFGRIYVGEVRHQKSAINIIPDVIPYLTVYAQQSMRLCCSILL